MSFLNLCPPRPELFQLLAAARAELEEMMQLDAALGTAHNMGCLGLLLIIRRRGVRWMVRCRTLRTGMRCVLMMRMTGMTLLLLSALVKLYDYLEETYDYEDRANKYEHNKLLYVDEDRHQYHGSSYNYVNRSGNLLLSHQRNTFIIVPVAASIVKPRSIEKTPLINSWPGKKKRSISSHIPLHKDMTPTEISIVKSNWL